MIIFDKASWHVDAGEPKEEVIKKFRSVFYFLHTNHLLSSDGEELYDLGLDGSTSLHEGLVTPEGKEFLEREYDKIINLSSSQIGNRLQELYDV